MSILWLEAVSVLSGRLAAPTSEEAVMIYKALSDIKQRIVSAASSCTALGYALLYVKIPSIVT